jgi:hypothetical protein
MTGHDEHDTDPSPQQPALDLWVRRLATLAVAGVAGYASYHHQADFALAGGADLTTARLWPLSVDGLLVLSTVGLLRDSQQTSRRAHAFLWAAFAAGIVVSLAANIATAPSMSWAPILVAGWPPVALLLAVELLGRHHRDRATQSESPSERDNEIKSENESCGNPEKVITLVRTNPSRHTAEQVMWSHYRQTVAAGRPAPTGAELDKVAHTNNYGRAVLRKWQRKGYPPAAAGGLLVDGLDGRKPLPSKPA